MKLPPLTRLSMLKWQTFQPRFFDFLLEMLTFTGNAGYLRGDLHLSPHISPYLGISRRNSMPSSLTCRQKCGMPLLTMR